MLAGKHLSCDGKEQKGITLTQEEAGNTDIPAVYGAMLH